MNHVCVRSAVDKSMINNTNQGYTILLIIEHNLKRRQGSFFVSIVNGSPDVLLLVYNGRRRLCIVYQTYTYANRNNTISIDSSS